MTGQEIITKFELYVGDQSDLSSQEELDLLNKVYDDVLNDRPWEFLKTFASGAIESDGTTAWITLPYDFRYFIENNQQTDIASTTENNASQKVVFIGPNYIPVQIVNWSDRRQYRNKTYCAYPDIANQKLIFTWIPNETTYEFDYIKQWEALTLGGEPLFPSDFHDMLFQMMAVDSVIINLFDKARSYADENQSAANNMMAKLGYWNSMQTFN